MMDLIKDDLTKPEKILAVHLYLNPTCDNIYYCEGELVATPSKLVTKGWLDYADTGLHFLKLTVERAVLLEQWSNRYKNRIHACKFKNRRKQK
jgi:hypothetical protein